MRDDASSRVYLARRLLARPAHLRVGSPYGLFESPPDARASTTFRHAMRVAAEARRAALTARRYVFVRLPGYTRSARSRVFTAV